jgi:uncharacterized membrane protein
VTFADVMERVAQAFEVIGAAVLLLGLLVSAWLGLRTLRATKDGRRAYLVLRQSFGGVILLGLEILVAADLVRTVAVQPTLESVTVLGLIVVIRTVLSFSLETEIDGVPPWRRAAASGVGHIVRAARSGADDLPPARDDQADVAQRGQVGQRVAGDG